MPDKRRIAPGQEGYQRRLSGKCLVREFEATAESVPSKVARSA